MANVFGQMADLAITNARSRNRPMADKPKARAAYQDFFTLWKNADPDIPILKRAQTEYAKLE